jgi:hypothetical protein
MQTERRYLAGSFILLALAACSAAGDDVSSRTTHTGSSGSSNSNDNSLGTGDNGSSSGDNGQITGSGGSSSSGQVTSGAGGSASSGTGTPGTGGSAPAAGGSTGAGGSSVGGTNTCVATPLAVANAVISNFDDAADMGLDVMAVSPGGKWTVDKDGSSGTATLAVEDTGATDQKKAAHFHGSGLTTWGADIAATFSGPTTPIDGSTYTGISFKVKAGTANKATALIVKLQNADSLPACGMCDPNDMTTKACYAGYAASATFSGTGWTTVQIPWTMLKAPAWGLHTSTTIDPKQLFVISIAVDKGIDFDLWIDDVAFYK